MWKLDEIVSSLNISEYEVHLNVDEILVHLLNKSLSFGVGTNSKGEGVLILPGQTQTLGFETNFATYNPWTTLKVKNPDTELPGVSVLECSLGISEQNSKAILGAIFHAILELEMKYGNSGQAIWQMKQIFETGFSTGPSEEVVTGLIGEIALLKISQDPDELIKFWHSQSSEIYDYSGDNVRIEVKSTKSRYRNHKLTSSQFPPRGNFELYLASVMVHYTEVGKSFYDFFNELQQVLTDESREKLHMVVLETLHVAPVLIDGFNIDELATLGSVKLFPVSEVPVPVLPSGILSCEWVADFELPKISLDEEETPLFLLSP